jgi:hypothetical protein
MKRGRSGLLMAVVIAAARSSLMGAYGRTTFRGALAPVCTFNVTDAASLAVACATVVPTPSSSAAFAARDRRFPPNVTADTRVSHRAVGVPSTATTTSPCDSPDTARSNTRHTTMPPSVDVRKRTPRDSDRVPVAADRDT